MRGLVVAVSACCVLFTRPTSVSARRLDAFAISLNVEFDATIPAHVIRTGMLEEAAAIWRTYGVDLLWNDTNADAPLHLDVAVVRYHRPVSSETTRAVLARTVIDRSGVVCGPIRILFDPIAALLERRSRMRPAFHDLELGRALGRVLAHELGHVLLGPPGFHDSDGLMRAAIPADDLAAADRDRFHLTNATADRLRAAVAHLSVAERGEICASE
jgi:hypothetical protein